MTTIDQPTTRTVADRMESRLTDKVTDAIGELSYYGVAGQRLEQEDTEPGASPVFVGPDGTRYEVDVEVFVRVLPPQGRTHMGEIPLTGRVFYGGGTEDAPADLSDVMDRDGVPWERDAITDDWFTFGGIHYTWRSLRDTWGPLSEVAG